MNAIFKLAPQRTTELNPAAPMLRYLRNDAGGRYFAGAHGGRPDGRPEPGNEEPAASFDRSGALNWRRRLLRSWITSTILVTLALCLGSPGARAADSSGKQDYLANCARCHGADGKGAVPAMRATRGYVAVDLTELSSAHDGHFPRQEVYDAIDGRKRFPAHLVGDMPVWGLEYRVGQQNPDEDKRVSAKIWALVDYIESLQQN